MTYEENLIRAAAEATALCPFGFDLQVMVLGFCKPA